MLLLIVLALVLIMLFARDGRTVLIYATAALLALVVFELIRPDLH